MFTGFQKWFMHSTVKMASNENSDEGLLTAKITTMVVLFFMTGICAALPFWLNRWLKWTEQGTNTRTGKVLQCILQFGGGVLLCTACVYLLPEVQEIVEALEYCGFIPTLKFGLSETLMCTGFLLMYFIEVSIHSYIHRQAQQRERHALEDAEATVDYDAKAVDVNAVENVAVKDTAQSASAATEFQISSKESHHHHHANGHSHMPIDSSEEDKENSVTAALRGLLLVVALSLHELFEGMAIGLEESASTVWLLFASISIHKLVLAFCVGVELLIGRTRRLLCIIYILTYSIVSPIGIGVGMLVSVNEDASVPSLTSAILQGLACGTLLYVVFFEILAKNHIGFAAFFSLTFGFALMFGLLQLHDELSGNVNCGSTNTITYSSYKLFTGLQFKVLM